LLLCAALAFAPALVAAPDARAHGITGSYRSAISSVNPATPGLDVQVVAGGGDLKVTDTAGAVIIIDGYEDEPYLRFTPTAVYRNTHSPATYLNETSDASSGLPPGADASLAPQWEKVSDSGTYQWHDHRIHWMASNPPTPVQDHPGSRAHIFDWKIGGSVDGRPLVVRGTLDWVPRTRHVTPILVGVILLNVLFLGWLAWRVGMLRPAPRPG
jgi:hypothetical protein